MAVLSRVLPGILVMLVALLAALPWGLPGEVALMAPLLPYVAIHMLVERQHSSMPDWLVFLVGLATDVLGQGPLGYWALVYLVGFVAAQAVTTARKIPIVGGILLFALTLSALVLVQWLVASIYRLRLADALPLLGAAAGALVVYAALAFLLPTRASEARRVNDRLTRGI